MLGDQHPIDEDGQQVELTEVASEHLSQLLPGALYETPRYG
jgi:hypothetical protein